MSTEKTDALIIRLADWSESSRVVTLFTSEWGRVSAIAKGAKRLKGPFESALDLLSTCRVVFIRKSSEGLDILTEAKLVRRFAPVSGSLEALYAGYYLAELLAGLTEDYDPHPRLYEETLATLDRLSESGPLELIVLHWELVLLEEIGQLPNFETCSGCDREVAPDIWFDFSVAQGGLICPECHPHIAEARPIQPGTLAILRQLSLGNTQTWSRLVVSPSQHRELRRLLTPTICHTLGKRPKMMDYLKFLQPRAASADS